MSGRVGDQSKQWAEVLKQEHAAINLRRATADAVLPAAKRRQQVRSTSGQDYAVAQQSGNFDTSALCLSGGGIRSAAFAMGAVQALEVNGHFSKFDYLSTVSGGGYLGTAVTSAMSANGGTFPLLNQASPYSDSDAIQHIRDFSNYLLPKGFMDVVRDVAIVIRGLAAIAINVLPVVLLLAVFTLICNPNLAALVKPPFDFSGAIGLPLFFGRFAWTATLLVLLPTTFAAWAMYRSVVSEDESEFGGRLTSIAAWLLLALAVVAFFELQPFLVAKMFGLQKGSGNTVFVDVFAWLKSAAIAAGSVFTVLWAFASRLGDLLKFGETGTGWKSWSAKITSLILLWAGALALPVFIWAVYLLLVYWGIPNGDLFNPPSPLLRGMSLTNRLPVLAGFPPAAMLYLVLGLCLGGLALLLRPNANSLHRLYRDRLEEAFISNKAVPGAASAAGMKLSQLRNDIAPLHIINCAINIQGSRVANRRERNADFFHFSQLLSGSALTGFYQTKDFEQANRSLTLAAAMAISGAAVSSNMGSSSIRVLTPTLALLNLRLGFWLKNPANKGKSVNAFYLLKEMFWRLTPADRWLYLTDGGHVENLGLYAMIKRRCRLIMLIDAEADPQMTFAALIKVERYARIDLGCRIDICWDAVAECTRKVMSGDDGTARGPHCAIGEINYGNGGKGILIYVKSSLTGDENNYVKDYARRHALFPHETTGDQFFNEEQFEVYRALGFHAVHALFKRQDPDGIVIPMGKLQLLRSGNHPSLKAARDVLSISASRSRR